MNTEVKVGLLFFVGLGLALWFTLFVGDIGGGEPEYWVRFPRVSGLDGGAVVAYNGVKIGIVREVEPRLENGIPVVAVGFDIEPEDRTSVLIGENTRFRINQGMLGGANLEILNVSGGGPIDQARLDAHLGETPVTIGEALEQISDLVAENRDSLKQAIDKLPGAIDNFSQMSDEIRGTVADNREELGRAVTNIADMSGEVQAFVKENREGVNVAIGNFGEMSAEIRDLVKENREDVRRAIAALPETIENAREFSDELKQILKENREALRTAMAGFASFAPKLDRIGEDVSKITTQIASGQGTLGRLVFEDTLHDKAVTAVDSFEQRLDEVEPFTAGFSDLKFYTGLRGGYNTESGASTGTAYIRIEPRPWKFYEAGVGYRGAPDDRDVADEDPDDFNIDLHFAFGWRFFPSDRFQQYLLTVQGGLFESAIGGQVDYLLWDNLTASVMVRDRHDDYDPDERRYEAGEGPLARATIGLRVWKRVTLVAGVDDFLDDPEPWVGISGEILDNDIRNLTTATGVLP